MLSVILPSFNDEKKISLALSSALEVQYVNEIIIVDDCSTDGTENLIKKLQYKFKKIKYFKNKENLGSGLSFIEGLKNSTNKYLIMLNSDDFFIPKGIEKLFKYQIKFNLDVAYGKMAIKKSSGVFKYSHPGYKNYSYSGGRNELVDLLIHDMYMPSFGTIIKKNVLKDFYNKNYYKKLICEYGGEFKAHDYDLFINLAKKRKKFGFLNETVCVWCPNKNSQSGENYFNSGQACYESAFLFNKYSKQERIDKKSISLISSRIKNKLKHKKTNSSNQYKISKHYYKFLSEIKSHNI